MFQLKTKKIWDESAHCAFTDLLYCDDFFLLSFREADSHCAGQNGIIRILSSTDGEKWQSQAQIALLGYDLRDPMLSAMPNGRLMMNMGASRYEGKTLVSMGSCVSFSDNGKDWSIPQLIDLKGEWLWRVTWHKGVGYSAAYSVSDLNDLNKPWTLKLYKTADGINFSFISYLDVPSHPNETTLRFLPDGRMMAMARRNGSGWIGFSLAPFTSWQWYETDYRFGGPNFLIENDNIAWAASRKVERKWWHKLFGGSKCSVILAKILDGKYEPVVEFPSGGDCGYPGLAKVDEHLYISYYSSHEKKSSIYFASFVPSQLLKLEF